MTALIQDLRYGLRMLAKNPGFTAIAILTLALGIGANTAIFSVVNAVLLRPLPYPDSNRLVTFWMTIPEMGYSGPGAVCDPDYREWESQNRVFDGIAAFHGQTANLTGSGIPERLQGAEVTASLFPLLGAAPVVGRNLLPGDQVPGHENVVVLSHQLWGRRFGADPAVVGKSITLDGKPFIVAGVMAAGFEFPNQTEFWSPLVLSNDCSNAFDQVVARLKPGVTPERARNDLAVISRRLALDRHQNPGEAMDVILLKDEMVSYLRLALLILLGAVGLVLLIACANVAGLLLARATARQREISIRKALGASRGRITCQLLTESVLLGILGGGLGLVLAVWGRETLISMLPQTVMHPGVISRMVSVTIDPWVLSFTALISLATGAIFGLAPALQVSRGEAHTGLKESGTAHSAGIRLRSARNLFVVGELALTVVLLVSAGLLIKSLLHLMDVKPGFDPENVLTMNLVLPPAKYQTEVQMRGFHDAMLEKVGGLPGVRAAGTISYGLPLGGSGLAGDFTIEGQAAPPKGVVASKLVVSPGYFRGMGISLLQGRLIADRDASQSAPVVVVSESFAKQFWPGGQTLGHKLQPGFSGSPWYSIVGIVSDVRERGLAATPPLALYFPYAQAPRSFLMSFMTLVVRTSTTSPLAATNAVRGAVQAVDPDMPVFEVASMEQLVEKSVSAPRFNATLLGCFAVLALILAAVGIYGTVSFAVTQRTHEIGIRMALGAERSDVLRLIVRQGMVLTTIGVGIGVVAALAVTRFLSTLLFAVKPTDTLTFVAVALVLSAVSFLASYIPARRATKVDPIVALRYE
jgi:putative ABC transport system permease protein